MRDICEDLKVYTDTYPIVIDLFSRKVIDYAFSKSPDSALTQQALKVAFESRGCSKNSDQGSHYTSSSYQKSLWCYGIKPSLSR